MHYAIRYKKRIHFLEGMIQRYYMANYKAKKHSGINPGVCCVTSLEGDEEPISKITMETLKLIIKNLPLWDCGC